MIAAQKGHDEMARILLGEGKCKKDQVDAVNDGLQNVNMLELVCPECGFMVSLCTISSAWTTLLYASMFTYYYIYITCVYFIHLIYVPIDDFIVLNLIHVIRPVLYPRTEIKDYSDHLLYYVIFMVM